MIESIIRAISARVRRIIAGTGLVALFGLLMRWLGKRDAKAKRRADDMEDAYDRERTRNEIERNSATGDARGKLHDKWRRD